MTEAALSLGIEYAIYDPATGEILEVRKTARMETAEANCPAGMGLYIGRADPKTQRVSDGALVARTERSQDELMDAIMQEYGRRLAQGFDWNGVNFQCDEEKSQPRITSMGALAGQKVAAGEADSLRWLDADNDFYWIASDNSNVRMTAAQMVDFAGAAALFASRLITTAAALKRLDPIPQNVADSTYWEG